MILVGLKELIANDEGEMVEVKESTCGRLWEVMGKGDVILCKTQVELENCK